MSISKSMLIIALSSMVWSFGLDLFRPVRKYVMRRTYFKRFRRMLKDSSNLPEKDRADANASCCPSCRLPFDKGKKRRLVDTCGHQRCYTCIFTTDNCPLCPPQGQPRIQATRQTNSFLFPRQVQAQTRPNTISIDNEIQLGELAKQHNASSNAVQKVSSFWALGENPHYHQHGISRVEIHSHMHSEASKNEVRHRLAEHRKEKIKPVLKKNDSMEMKIDFDASNSPGSTLSMSSRKDWTSSSNQNLRSREQSVMSLMSISSRSSATPMDALKHTDHRSRLCNQRFSLAQCSNFSLDLSTEASAPEKAATIYPLTLKPLYFEVPQSEADPIFIGRQWVYREIEKVVLAENSDVQGVIVIGGPGSGKTSLILQLVDYSSFGRKWKETVYQTTQEIYWKINNLGTCSDGDQMSISSRGSTQKSNEAITRDSVVHRLASRVVGYHFCQSDYNSTCLIPDFVHSLAAQLCQAPQLVEYRNLLMKEPRYQELLSLDSCITDPDSALSKGIIEPLNLLTKIHQIQLSPALIVVDSIHEAESFQSAGKETLSSFLSKHMKQFPSWLKLFLTVRTANRDVVTSMPLHSVSLDRYSSDVNNQQDLLSYIGHRIRNSSRIQSNITANRKDEEEYAFARFAEHLTSLSQGSFLYAKLTLDLLQQGHLVIKSSSFSVLPVSLSQVFMLNFNLKFTSTCSFDRVKPILEVCLASMYPLTALEAYYSCNARYKNLPLSWIEFLQQLEMLTRSQILVHRQDGSLMVLHPALKEWLIKREKNEGNKFICDLGHGHADLALRMTRLEAPVSPEHGLELAHHLLQANVFSVWKDFGTNGSWKEDFQAFWLQHCLRDPSTSLSHQRNVFAPDIKVCRLLLQAGASSNVSVGTENKTPLLKMASQLGFCDLVSLLLEYGADCDAQSHSDSVTPLMAACKRGHHDVVQILLAAGAKIHLKDTEGRTALSYAGEVGHLEIIKSLLRVHCSENDNFIYREAINGAFVAAAGNGHIEVCVHLLRETDIQLNYCDPASGHTPLTFASWKGHTDVCRLLLQKGATVTVTNSTGAPPIIWAARGTHWNVVEILTSYHATLTQTDKEGRTPLMWAAAENNLEILQMLLQKDTLVDVKDFTGMTALTWACSENHIQAAEFLLNHKSNVESLDSKGRTSLILATKHEDGKMVQLLLKHGANMEHKDYSGATSLDHAMISGNIVAVSKFLHQGVKLGPKVWCRAEGKPTILLILLHKLLSDGVVLYKKENFQEAGHRFQYALKKFPPGELQGEKEIKFQQLKFYLELGFSRCNRKMKDYEGAIKAADGALKLRPESFEALYVRARARHEAGYYQEALLDVTQALHLSNSDMKAKRTLQNLRADILTSSKIVCPLDGIDVECSRPTVQKRPQDDASPLSPSMILLQQPCRPLIERGHRNNEVGKSSLSEKRLTFCIASELTSPVH